MSAGDLLYSTLSGNAGVTAIVGSKIYPDALPEDISLPFIAFESGREPVYGLDDVLRGVRVSVLVACWSTSRSSAIALANASIAALATANIPYDRSSDIYESEIEAYATVVEATVWE